METPRQTSTYSRISKQLSPKSKEYVRLTVTPTTQKLVRSECVRLFLKNNPQFAQYTITDDIIIDRIARYYLE